MNKHIGWLLALVVGVGSAQSVGSTYPLNIEGGDAAGWRLGVWQVSAYGQPQNELSAVALSGSGAALPALATPSETLPVNSSLSWPGLVDFASASSPARVAETKFFLYKDTNNNAKRDEGETMREVRVSAKNTRGALFLVWASEDVIIKAGRGYEAHLKKGWNPLLLEVKSQVNLSPWPQGVAFSIKLP